MTPKEANALLPDKPTSKIVNPAKLSYLLIAQPKWGKTKFFMQFPNALLLAFEAGHSFQRGYKVIIDKWDQERGRHEIYKDEEGCSHMTMMQALEVLESSKKFDFIIIDTTDMAVKMCVDYECGKRGVEHSNDAGDYGKGWDVTQNSPFRKAMLRILKTGRGIGFITHTKNEIAKFTSGEVARKESTLPNGVMRYVYGQADVVMHGEFGRKQAGRRLRDRVLVCEGDMDTMAGNRSGAMLPARYIVSPDKTWEQFKSFFTDATAADKAEAEYKSSLSRKGK